MVMFLALASMLFSTNSAIALRGLVCERAIMVMAFQLSPIRSWPLSPPELLFEVDLIFVSIKITIRDLDLEIQKDYENTNI
jgi:hypothetical protein